MPGVIAAPGDDAPQSGPGEFPLACLPPVLRDMAAAIADVSRVPLDMIGPCILATASACMGQGITVKSAPGMVTAGNLFLLLVKPSGAGGSVAYSHATRPLRGYQAEALREFDEVTKPGLEVERATLRADYDKALADRKAARKEGDQDALNRAEKELKELQTNLAANEFQNVPPYIWVTDSTPERLASLMAGRGETLAHFDPDGSDSVAAILGIRYGNGDHAADSLHLKAFARESVAISRQGSGKGGASNTFLASPCLTTLFVVTPDIAKKLSASERMMRGGFLARFLLVNSTARPQPWATHAREVPGDVAGKYERAAFSLLNNYRNRGAGECEPIEMTGEAFDLFAADYAGYCDRFEPEFSAFDSRHTEQAIRLALVFHAWEHIEFPSGSPAIPSGHKMPMNGATARAGLKMFAWFAAHQAEMLAPQREAAKAGKFERLLAWCERRNVWGIASRDLLSAKIAASAEDAERMLADWETESRIVREHSETSAGSGGRPKGARYRVRKPTPGL